MKLSRFLALALFLFLILPARGDSTTGEISEAEVVSFVKNSWAWTSFTDNVIITALDGTYEGLPYRDHIKAVIVGLELHQYYDAGQDSEATRVILTYAGTQTVKLALKSVGLRGVSAVASAASWPVEWGIGRFRTAVHDKGYNTEKALYFATRAHNTAEAILNAQDADLLDADANGGLVTKEGGWLRPAATTYTTVPSIPGMTPAEAFSAFETEWLCKHSAADFDGDNDTLREAFGLALRPTAPTITTDLVDQTIVDGQSATFTVAASGTGPFQYVWEMNGSPILVAIGPTFTATAAAQYRVTVYDAGNLSVRSRAATLTVLPPGVAVTLTAPGAGATAGGTYTARASASGATKVEFWLDGVRRFTDTSAPFTWPWNTTLEDNGSHQLVAKAYNGATLLGTTPARNVTVNNTVAPGSDTYEPNNSSLTATVVGLGESRTAYVGSPSDVDWFSVQVTTPGVLTFDLSVPAANDYDIELFGPDTGYIKGSYRDAGLAENITHNAVITGTYWVRIYGYPIGNGSFNATNAYTLTANFTSGAVNVSAPQNQSVPWGASAAFTVVASNVASFPMTYQWQRNGVDIPGAHSATYRTPPTSLSGNGDQFTVRVTSFFGSVISAAALLVVTDPPFIRWTAAISNDWNDPLNWDLHRVPVANDIARIYAGAGVSLSGNAAGTIILQGTLNWLGGTISGSLTVASGGVINLSGTGDKYLSGGVLNNGGAINWSGGNIRLDYGAAVNNLASGTFNVLVSDMSFYWAGLGNQPSFNNAGTFRKSTTTGTAYLSGLNFTNTGLVELQNGSLSTSGVFNNDGTVNNTSGVFTMSGGGTSNGTFYAGVGATNDLPGSEVFGAGVSFTGAGVNRASGSLSLNGTYNFQGLAFSGGISGNFTLNGSLTWTGGTLTGTAMIGLGGVLNLSGTGDKYLSGGVLNNGGTISWSGGNIRLDYGAAVNNLAGGTFNVLVSDMSFYWAGLGNRPSFNNAGTFRKSATTGAVYFSSLNFVNTGLVDAQRGTIQITGGTGTSNGSFNAASGAAIDYASVSFADGASFTGTGVNRIIGSAGMAGSLTSQNLELGGGSIGGTATITGTMSWTSGTINGVLTLTSGGVFNVSGTGDKYLSGGVLNNGGMLNWSGGNIRLDYGAAVNNLASGTFNAQVSDMSFYWAGLGSRPSFHNTGTINIEASIVYFSGITPNLGTGSVLKGTGHLGGTTLNISGNATLQNFELTGGNTFTGTGNGTITGALNWAGGTISGSLTVASGGVLNVSGTGDKYLSGGVLNNGGTINWSGGNIRLDYGATVNNLASGTFNVMVSEMSFYWAGLGSQPSFNNAGTFRKSTTTGTAYLSGLSFTNTGLVDLQSGSLNVSGFTQLSGKIALWGGTFNASQGLQLMGGELSGVGLVNGAVNNTGGVVKPGIGIGTLIVIGAYSQSATGTLVLEIKPTTTSIEYDWFVVTGLATLGGVVQVELVNGSSPVLGQTFVPITFGSRSGAFSSLELPVFGEDLTFDASLSATTFSLSVARTAFGAWKQTKFGADASNTGIAGAMSDPDHDGTPNLLEFSLCMEPLIAGQMSKLPGAIQVTVASQDYPAIRFRRLSGASPGVSYTVQESTNLNGWLPVDLVTCQVGAAVNNGDGTETITVRSTMPMRGATSPGKAFLRVEVTEN